MFSQLSLPTALLQLFTRNENHKALQISLPPISIHDIENSPEKPTRRLKQLLKLNHATYSILYNNLAFYNHVPALLSTAYLFGGDADHLTRLYEVESKELEPWVDSPAEISGDWREFLGKREYQRTYLDFFEDELVRYNYDWKMVAEEYLGSGETPLINASVSGFGHPLIHLGYAFEMSSKEIGMEALAMIACCDTGDLHKFLDHSLDTPTSESAYKSSSPFGIIDRIQSDQRLTGIFESPGGNNVETLFKSHETLLLEYCREWDLTEANLTEQFEATQQLAATLLVTRSKGQPQDFFFVHILNTNHALRVLITALPAKFHIPLLRQWWLLAIATYIAQLRPKITPETIRKHDTQDRDWEWIGKHALHGEMSASPHYIKPLRTLREAATTWGDADQFYLRTALKFIDEFDEFGGFGA